MYHLKAQPQNNADWEQAMRTIKLAAILMAVLAVAAWRTASAQEAGARGTVATVKAPVKHYKVLPLASVYRAALDNIQADVRLHAAFRGRTTVADAVSRVTVANVEYLVVAAFRVEGDRVSLVCLVPDSSLEALRTLFGVPADRPLTVDVLNWPTALNAGQEITVEGTIVGAAVGEKFVLADSVLRGGEVPAPTYRELQVAWPGGQQPQVIAGPGTVTLNVPCAHAQGKTVSAKVTVQAATPAVLMAELARITAEREGLPGAVAKTYGSYSAGAVYRHATQNNRINVDFTDSVSRLIGLAPPIEIATAPALRGGMPVSVRVGYAFRTTGDIVCLVPADDATLVGRAIRTLPGEEVRIRGTITGRQGASACMLVDYIGFPGQEAAGEGDTWLVTIEWPGSAPRVFWDYGLYDLVGLPCPDSPGQFEMLRVQMVGYKLLEVELPPEGAAPVAP